MNGQNEEIYSIGGISDDDIEEGLRQAEQGDVVDLDTLRKELEERRDDELESAGKELIRVLTDMKSVSKSWDTYAQSVIDKVKNVR